MAYEPTNWKSGDVVTSAKLNKLEQAVASGGVMVVNIVDEDPAQSAKNLLRGSSTRFLDKTWQEIYDTMFAGAIAVVKRSGGENDISCYQITDAYSEEGQYTISAGEVQYVASSADSYPETS